MPPSVSARTSSRRTQGGSHGRVPVQPFPRSRDRPFATTDATHIRLSRGDQATGVRRTYGRRAAGGHAGRDLCGGDWLPDLRAGPGAEALEQLDTGEGSDHSIHTGLCVHVPLRLEWLRGVAAMVFTVQASGCLSRATGMSLTLVSVVCLRWLRSTDRLSLPVLHGHHAAGRHRALAHTSPRGLPRPQARLARARRCTLQLYCHYSLGQEHRTHRMY